MNSNTWPDFQFTLTQRRTMNWNVSVSTWCYHKHETGIETVELSSLFTNCKSINSNFISHHHFYLTFAKTFWNIPLEVRQMMIYGRNVFQTRKNEVWTNLLLGFLSIWHRLTFLKILNSVYKFRQNHVPKRQDKIDIFLYSFQEKRSFVWITNDIH